VLLDAVLPEFDVSKRHRIQIRASPQRVFEEVLRYDFGRSRVTGVLMALRGYGGRIRRAARSEPGTLPESLARFGFVPLAAAPGEELVFGLVGQFWRPSGGLRSVSAAEFAAFREPGFAKAAWNLRIGGGSGLHLPHQGSGLHLPHCELSTETRVVCYGDSTRRRFLLYWRVVEPFSGLIRWSLLRGVRRAAEA
jgi:hypothetical protein